MTIRDVDSEICKTEAQKADALRGLVVILSDYLKKLDESVVKADFQTAEADYRIMRRFLKQRARLFDTINAKLLRLRKKKIS